VRLPWIVHDEAPGPYINGANNFSGTVHQWSKQLLAKFCKRDISSASERAFPGGFGGFFCCWTPSKRGCFHAPEFTRFLSTGVVSASSHVLWRVLSNKVIWVFGHCWLDISHLQTSEWDSLFSWNCVTVPPSDLDYVNKSTSLQQFRLTRTLAEPDDCIATRVVTSIRHWIVLNCERYWLAGVGGRSWARRTKSGEKNIGDGGGFSVKICKLSVRQSPCCLLDICVLLPVRIKT